ncbi:MAG: NAD(+) diphosphatase [Agathobacter sp.]|nr:NAD(+) diphosphatase [Agathobacter sp.]
MIQDIFPHVMHNEYHTEAAPKPDDIVFCFEGSKLWVKAQPEISFLRMKELEALVSELPEFADELPELTYLFTIDEQGFYMTKELRCDVPSTDNAACAQSLNEEESIQPSISCIEIRELREKNQISQEMAFAAYTAKHLADWYRDNHFCGRCGGKMEHSKSERAMVCPRCGYTSYPRIMPAVIVGVIKGDELLITKYRVGYRHNALIAGFTEIGETLEETVAREVMEETGIRVTNIRYYKSQPWGIANDILVGYFCEAEGDTNIHMDEKELKYAQWTRREDIVLQPDSYSLTNEMMKRFKDGEACL